MSLNKVMLIGNVGRDPEVRYLDSNAPAGQGRKVATFTLATSEKYKDRNGEQRENTEWHNIVVWGNQADVVERYVKKGTQLYIEGRIRTRSWADSSGVKKYTTEINVDSLQLLGRRDASEGGYNQAGYPASQASYQDQSAFPAPGYQPQASAQKSYQQPAKPSYQPAPQSNVYQAPSPAIEPEDSDDLPF